MAPLRTLIHVGFGHSGTTSLQENLFPRRPDLFYCGIPYGNCGGIFSDIKYKPDGLFDRSFIAKLCRRFIFDRRRDNQTVVISDETLVEQPEVYYTPSMLPIRTIAERLRSFFPDARILFTTRNQIQYVVSSYLNLKRNYARLAQRPIEPFDTWFEGNHSQVANQFLRNLDYSHAIKTYVDVFGRDSVLVLPLEQLRRDGADSYLGIVGDYLGIAITADDVAAHAPIRNSRMTVLENALIECCSATDHFQHLLQALAHENEFDRSSNLGRPVEIVLSPSQRERIAARAAAGNAFIGREFGIPLAAFGYPMPAPIMRLRAMR